MMTRLGSRRWLAVLALAASTNAGGTLAAQGPARGITAAPRAPKLLSECDVTVEGCGSDGSTLYGTGTTSGSTSGTTSGGSYDDATMPVCGAGTKTECRRDTVTRCLKWVTQTVSLNAGVTNGGGTVTTVCAESVTSVFYYYWA